MLTSAAIPFFSTHCLPRQINAGDPTGCKGFMLQCLLYFSKQGVSKFRLSVLVWATADWSQGELGNQGKENVISEHPHILCLHVESLQISFCTKYGHTRTDKAFRESVYYIQPWSILQLLEASLTTPSPRSSNCLPNCCNTPWISKPWMEAPWEKGGVHYLL